MNVNKPSTCEMFNNGLLHNVNHVFFSLNIVFSFVIIVHQGHHKMQSGCALKRNTFTKIEAAKAP